MKMLTDSQLLELLRKAYNEGVQDKECSLSNESFSLDKEREIFIAEQLKNV